MELSINFYDEINKIKFPSIFSDLKKEVSKLLSLEPKDVDELIYFYFDLTKIKFFIKNEEDFKNFRVLMNNKVVLYIEINEESQLFKKDVISQNIENCISVDKLKLEILEKERVLKEALEKEKKAIQKKKDEEEKAKRREEEHFLKLNELREYKMKIEIEEERKRREDKNELQHEIGRIINEKIDKLKAKVIEESVTESILLMEKQNERKLVNSSVNKEVHMGIECSSCKVCPIIGVRYKCPVIGSFNLCEKCELILGENYQYPLLKIRNNNQAVMKIKIIQ